jgi:DNA-directed RNA polymerase specialized sigma24 family protein
VRCLAEGASGGYPGADVRVERIEEAPRPRPVELSMTGAIIPQSDAALGMALSGYGDERLATAIAAGETDALREAYRRYGPTIAAMAELMTDSLEEREAVVDEAFVALWRHAAAFDATRASFATWFVTLAHRRAVLRCRRNQLGRSADWAPRFDAVTSDDDEARKLVRSGFLGGWTHVELAKRTGMPVETVRSLLRLGLIRLTQDARSSL